ncbi:MAG: glycosyltransferase, partial [Bacilli bacterium]|nr:glycosyltransferase [Bacilli bacterium]
MKKKYSFIILHYLTIDDTINCINSIQKYFFDFDYSIIVVDNASSNGTGEQLIKKYNNDDKIKVILNKTNLGFAKGNNIGFKYAKDNIKPDFIIMINNDTFFSQRDFLTLVNESYEKYQFALMGPKIILKDNSIYQNHEYLRDIKTLKKIIRKLKIKLFFNKFYLLFFFQSINSKIKKVNKKEDENYNRLKHNVVIHGCCLIFSKMYIDKFDGIPDLTFLYCEEDLLQIRLLKNNLTSLYNPSIRIHHNQYGATDALNKTNRKKDEFVFKNLIKAYK